MKKKIKKRRYFVFIKSYPAPIFPDEDNIYIKAATPEDAIIRARKEYGWHLSGIASIEVYENADSFHENKSPLAIWTPTPHKTKKETKKSR